MKGNFHVEFLRQNLHSFSTNFDLIWKFELCNHQVLGCAQWIFVSRTPLRTIVLPSTDSSSSSIERSFGK